MAKKNLFKSLFADAVSTRLPMADTMDQYLDYILPQIKNYSEDLYEDKFILEKRWLEIRDDENFHEKVLHIFKPEQQPEEIKSPQEDTGSAYLRVIDGNVTKGKWSRLKDSNGLFIKHLVNYELYDLAFLNNEFLILKKNGGNSPRKYFVLIKEDVGKNLEWRECMELLFDVYRYNLGFLIFGFVVLAAVVAVVLMSI